MIETHIYELPINVRRRAGKIKEMLKEYRKKYEKIAVVAHYNTINFSLCKEFNEQNEPDDSADMKNCQIYPVELSEILQYSWYVKL